MTTSELVTRLKEELNRPSVDSLFTDPGDYHDALTRAQKYWYRRITTHYPELLMEEKGPVNSVNGNGREYDLGDDHLGEIEVWTPPGPPTGDIVPPAVPESRAFGYYTEGTKVILTLKKEYDPGIYVRWVPSSITEVDGTNDPKLPAYMEDALVMRAAFHLASTPGFMGDPNFYRDEARREWAGDPEDPSDAGILGTLSRQSAHRGLETMGDRTAPWYKRIP